MADYYKEELTAEQRAKFEQQVVEMTARIEVDTNDAETYCNRGVAHFGLKQYEAAIVDYDEAIELKPDFAEAYYNRGNARRELEQYEAAIADYDKAIELKPDYADPLYNRGNIHRELKQYEAAIVDYDKAIELEPGYAEAYNNRGITFRDLKRYNAAIKDFRKALELNPKDLGYANNLAINMAFQTSEKERIKITERLKKEYEEKLDKGLKKAEEKFSERLQDNAKTLQEKIDKHEKNVRCFSFVQAALLVVWCVGAATYFYCVFSKSGNFFSVSNFLPYASVALFISTPIIWGIKIIAQNILEAKSLKEDAMRRLFIENNLSRLIAENSAERAIREEMMSGYFTSWQTNSPVEILLQLNSRRIGPETILDKIFPSQKGTDD